jgi:cytochrome b6-f complex iron-sulfur subunit
MAEKEAKAEEKRGLWINRRSFLSVGGWSAFFTFLGTSLIGSVRFFFPRVLFEPSATFKAGLPDEYSVGSVSTRWVKSQKVWVIRNEAEIYALVAVCTHLGCTPRWLETENKFKCPCHGSGFHRTGVNFEGPAPRPLERVKITLADDGQIVVDKSVRYLYERGEWEKPGAFLRI